MDRINIEGFDFIKIGQAKWCDTGIQAKHQGKTFDWHLYLDLIDPDFAKAEQSAYLVFVDNELVYAGEYTNSFAQRWLRQNRYFWHSDNIDNKSRDAVEAGKEVTVWLTLNPYVEDSRGRKININKSIEQIIIENRKPAWNNKNKPKAESNSQTLSVAEILSRING